MDTLITNALISYKTENNCCYSNKNKLYSLSNNIGAANNIGIGYGQRNIPNLLSQALNYVDIDRN